MQMMFHIHTGTHLAGVLDKQRDLLVALLKGTTELNIALVAVIQQCVQALYTIT